MNESRKKSLIKNLFLFSISSFGPKVLSFLLVPLYTTLLTLDQYGTIDFITVTVSLLIPIFTIDISDAILRFTINKDDMNSPFNIGMNIFYKGFIILILLAIPLLLSVENVSHYIFLILSLYFVNALYLNLLAYLRGTNKVNMIVVSGIVNTFFMLLFNVLFLVVLHWRIEGYLFAMILGYFIADILIILKLKLYKQMRFKIKQDEELQKAMIRYSFPLVFSGIAWWMNATLDRYFITFMCGIEANGIYSMANKIPTMLTAFHTVIYQALQLSVIHEVNANDRNEFYKRMYRLYSFIFIFICCILIFMDKFFAGILYKSDFYVAWKYVPILLISITLMTIGGYLETILTAFKQTKSLMKTTLVGMLVNLILNCCLVPWLGIAGAGIATMFGYFAIWISRIYTVQKQMNAKLNYTINIVCFVLLFIQYLILVNLENNTIFQIIILILILIINKATFIEFVKLFGQIGTKLISKLKRR